MPHAHPKGRRVLPVGDRLALARSWTRGTGEHLAQITRQTWGRDATADYEEIVGRQKKNCLN